MKIISYHLAMIFIITTIINIAITIIAIIIIIIIIIGLSSKGGKWCRVRLSIGETVYHLLPHWSATS